MEAGVETKTTKTKCMLYLENNMKGGYVIWNFDKVQSLGKIP